MAIPKGFKLKSDDTGFEWYERVTFCRRLPEMAKVGFLDNGMLRRSDCIEYHGERWFRKWKLTETIIPGIFDKELYGVAITR